METVVVFWTLVFFRLRFLIGFRILFLAFGGSKLTADCLTVPLGRPLALLQDVNLNGIFFEADETRLVANELTLDDCDYVYLCE